MNKFITTTKLKELIDNAPSSVKPEEIMTELENSGYEIEGYNASFNPLEAVTNIPSSMAEFGKGIYTAIKNPIQTAKGLGTLALGAVMKLVPGEQDSEKALDAVVDFYVQRYGSKDRLLNTIEQDPAGFAADISTVFGIGGGVAKGVGAVIKSDDLLTAGERVARLSRVIDPGNATLKAIGKFNKSTGLTDAIKRSRKGSSTRLAVTGMDIPRDREYTIATQQGLTETGAKLVSEHGIHGTFEDMYQQTSFIQSKTRQTVDDLLGKINIASKNENAPKLIRQLENKLGIAPETYNTATQARINLRQARINRLENSLNTYKNIQTKLESLELDRKVLSRQKIASNRPIVGIDSDLRSLDVRINNLNADRIKSLLGNNEITGTQRKLLNALEARYRLKAQKLRSTVEPRTLNKNIRDIDLDISKLEEKLSEANIESQPLKVAEMEAKLQSEIADLDKIQYDLLKGADLSDEFTGVAVRLQRLKNKHTTTGLSLSEFNELKRMSDNFVDAFNATGEPKAAARNFAGLREGIKTHIENIANSESVPKTDRIPNLSKMNKQTQWAGELKDIFDYNRKSTSAAQRASVFNEIIVLGGILGATQAGIPALPMLVPFMSIIAARRLLRKPQVRTWLASKLQLMAEGDYRALEAGIQNPDIIGPKTLKALKNIQNSFKEYLPELRAMGVIDQQLEIELAAAKIREQQNK